MPFLLHVLMFRVRIFYQAIWREFDRSFATSVIQYIM